MNLYPSIKAIYRLLDWLFPPECAGCGQPGTRWCPDCIQSVSIFPSGLCPLCQKDLRIVSDANQYTVHTCARSNHLDQVHAWGWHSGPLRKAIHRLKYKRDLSLAENLSQHLSTMVNKDGLANTLVIPVPLWPGRQRQRGYNQAALLAQPLAYALQLAYQPRGLLRQRDTASQVGLSLVERRKNVADAFQAEPGVVKGRQILLVDDVLTTGSTLDSAAHALKQAGAVKITAVVLSRAH